MILRAAERAGTVLVLDETTADLDIDRGPVAARVHATAIRRCVVRIGSLGKTVWGGLRVGWIRAEADLVRRLVAARPAHDLGTPGVRAGGRRGAASRRFRRDRRAALARCCARGGMRVVGSAHAHAAGVAGAATCTAASRCGSSWMRRSARPS